MLTELPSKDILNNCRIDCRVVELASCAIGNREVYIQVYMFKVTRSQKCKDYKLIQYLDFFCLA